ncbi:MAG TPA: hypothetical protein VKF84_12870 [Candidatus Sulfotelmatobacter sp.]|nr:hypothetical protein [Candidatus Sulfotelmatobacter sp.]
MFDDKIQSVQLGTIAENKRLGVALALVKEQPMTCPPHQRRYPARQRPPNNLDAPGMPMKRRLSRCAAEVASAGPPGRARLTARFVPLYNVT